MWVKWPGAFRLVVVGPSFSLCGGESGKDTLATNIVVLYYSLADISDKVAMAYLITKVAIFLEEA